jgi:hypothetical protein
VSWLRAVPWILGLGAGAATTTGGTRVSTIRWGLVLFTAVCFGIWQDSLPAMGFSMGLVLLCIHFRTVRPE